jgi:hypothetical protein
MRRDRGVNKVLCRPGHERLGILAVEIRALNRPRFQA